MSDLALPTLFERVTARFAAEAAAADPPYTPPTQTFGWREPAAQGPTPRIVWVPGDDGNLGDFGPPQRVGGDERQLATLEERFTVYIVARDGTDPESELRAR